MGCPEESLFRDIPYHPATFHDLSTLTPVLDFG
jgi:hypothetical protein